MSNNTVPIIVIGASGRGKSTAIRNLDPESTLIINVEEKPLPFPHAKQFKHNNTPKTPQELLNWLDAVKDRPEYKTVVIDSFSAFTDQLMSESRRTKKGYDVFNYYNEVIANFFSKVKKCNKRIIIIGHDEVVTTAEGQTIKSLKVKGKEWEGVCEKEAIIVLHASMKRTEEGKNEYFFETQSDGVTSAKSPMGMFDTMEIPNDYQLVLEAIDEYYKDELNDEKTEIEIQDEHIEAIAPKSFKDEIIEEVHGINSITALTGLWSDKHSALQSEEWFKLAVREKRVQIEELAKKKSQVQG